MKKYFLYASAIVLFLFASLTFFLSSSVIFDLFGIREKEGNYVLLVVIANFICSLLYYTAVYGFFKRKIWTFKVLLISAVILVLAYAGLLYHINAGGLYEVKTLSALKFRFTVTLIFSVIAYFLINKQKAKDDLRIFS